MRGLPIQTELSAAELRALARRETWPRVAPRLYAIAHVLDGVSRAEAARLCGMDRQALRDAVVRFNAEGLGGLVDRTRPGREPRLSEGEQAALAGLILRGPRPEQSGLSSWTLADLCQEVEANWGKRFHPASMSRVVRRLGFSRQKARQVHPQSDAQAQAAFAKKGFGAHSTTRPRLTPASGSRCGFRTRPGSARKAAPAIALVAEGTAPAWTVRPALHLDIRVRCHPARHRREHSARAAGGLDRGDEPVPRALLRRAPG